MKKPLTPSLAFLRASYHVGLFARVAETLQVSKASVSKVAHGHRRDDLIFDAIVDEVHLIDERLDAVAKDIASNPCTMGPDCPHCAGRPAPLSAEEQVLFQYGGRYYGVFSKVAAEQNRTPHLVGMVARGKRRNDAVLAAVREAMARVDADLFAAKAAAE